MTVTTLLTRCPVVPVVVLDHPDQALPLGKALLAGGIDVVEITLRTDAGLESIRRLAELPGLHVGSGLPYARGPAPWAGAGEGYGGFRLGSHGRSGSWCRRRRSFGGGLGHSRRGLRRGPGGRSRR